MRSRRLPRLFAVFAAVCLLTGRANAAESLKAPIVATHYFYWYRWPDQHFNQPGAPGLEGHYHHFKKPKEVSWENVDWHREQFAAMHEAGIDVALPVYWGAPGAYDRPSLDFSQEGIEPMVRAIRSLDGKGVKLGLFYDTTTLRNCVRGVSPPDELPDLTTAEGKQLFCDTVIEYFGRVPPDLWARIDGRPLVVLYTSGFAKKWDANLGPELAARFEKRFPGEKPFLVADASWGEIGQDRITAWGAALNGPQLFPGIAQIGPGYNDTPIPGRTTPIREREDGNFYRSSWRAALAHRPQLVLVETWSELHEGTEICETIEMGRKYLDLTAEWTAKLKRGDDPGSEIPLQYPNPIERSK